MRIGYDGKRAVFNNTGLGNYSRLLVDVLSDRYPEHEYILFSPRLQSNPRLEPLLKKPNVSVETPDTAIGRAAASIWRIQGVTSQLSRSKIDLAHGLSGELPLNIGTSNIPTVVTIHDLIFRKFPECYNAIDREIYDYKFRNAAVNATRVLAISKCTKRDLINEYDINPDRIDVVYQGCHAQFKRTPSKEEIESVKARYGLDRPYIISVGTVERRKNQIMTVRGVRGLPEDFDVVLVGRHTSYVKEIQQYVRQYNITDRVKFLDKVPFADLPALYAGAFCSSYTSRYEGFGIPVIESLAVGTPVIVATGSCLEEAGGPDVPAVDPDDVEEWVNTVKELVNYPNAHRKIAVKGKAYINRFSDLNMATDTMTVYQRALDSSPLI